MNAGDVLAEWNLCSHLFHAKCLVQPGAQATLKVGKTDIQYINSCRMCRSGERKSDNSRPLLRHLEREVWTSRETEQLKELQDLVKNQGGGPGEDDSEPEAVTTQGSGTPSESNPMNAGPGDVVIEAPPRGRFDLLLPLFLWRAGGAARRERGSLRRRRREEGKERRRTARAAKKKIAILRCTRTVSDYNNKFDVEALKLKKAGTSEWDLLNSYIEGLLPAVMFQTNRQEPQTLQEAMEKALDNEALLQQASARGGKWAKGAGPIPGGSPPIDLTGPAPMELCGVRRGMLLCDPRLPQALWEERWRRGLCLRCGDSNH
uniref:Uncharacterized protein n=1 Tax=Chromera velia CCMP2878 TaxID=1169474 RepID=A0A0G4GQY4_9ALVE|eukprot:Cvel_22990.t1-p1 / transcript=Cvel_22990.t1 / gene=Cvel_22990 / organism=Chromera_velia_CCMP2878 / gene_product=hypothetical protein / transcript_product=hypothetical protein / location=Cvel_scaffold2319:20203-23082(-) / protein_length=317 / sequence_SO=supercontig / SO=protein_coding / is_pseudo=false